MSQPFRSNSNRNVSTRRDQAFHHLKSNFAQRVPLANANDANPEIPTNLIAQKPPGGYEEGSLIYNQSNNSAYVRTTDGGAPTWTLLNGGGGGGTSTLQQAYDATVTAMDNPSIQTEFNYGPVTIFGSDDGMGGNNTGLIVSPSSTMGLTGTQPTTIMVASPLGSALQLFSDAPGLIFDVESDGTNDNVVMGNNASILGSRKSVAIGGGGAGGGARATGLGSVSIGGGETGAEASGQGSIAIGGGEGVGVVGPVASNIGSIAIGAGATAMMIPFPGAQSLAAAGIAIGVNCSLSADSDSSVVIGGGSSNTSARNSVTIGSGASCTGGFDSITMGLSAQNNDSINSVAMGTNATCTGLNPNTDGANIAIGQDAQVVPGMGGVSEGIAIGGSTGAMTSTRVSVNGGIAIGANARAETNTNDISLGTNAFTVATTGGNPPAAQLGLTDSLFSANVLDNVRAGSIQVHINGTNYWIPLLTVS